MATGGTIVNNGLNLFNKRAYGTSVTALSRFKIGTGTTTPVVTATGLATPITAWSGGSDFKNFVSGYPVFDNTNKLVTVRGFVATTEANANTITETGEFNTDGTPLMASLDVFTGIVKTTQVEIALIWRHQSSTA